MNTRHVRRAGARRRALGLAAVGTAAGMLGIASTALAGDPSPPDDGEKEKVTLCHATGSATNPYVQITTSPQGALNGHAKKHAEDVIPPFDDLPDGKNWTSQGQALAANTCFPLGIVKQGDKTVLPGGTISYAVTVTNLVPGTFDYGDEKKPQKPFGWIPFEKIKVMDLNPKVKLTPPVDPPEYLKPQETATWTGTRRVRYNLNRCGAYVSNRAWAGFEEMAKQESSKSLKSRSRKRTKAVDEKEVQLKGVFSETWMTQIICPLDVAITKTPTQATVEPGGTVGYQIAVTNTGPLPVPTTSIMVSDEGATLTPPADMPKYLEPKTSLLWGASKAVAADTSVCGTNVENTASVKLALDPEGPKYTFEPGADDVATAVGIPVSGGICPVVAPASIPEAPVITAFRPASPAALSVTKTGPARALRGGFVNFRVTVTNDGGATATGVTLADTPARAMQWRAVPSGAKVSGSTATWTIGDLAPGQSVSKVVRMRMRTSATGRSCNTAVATATGLDQARARACVRVVAARRPATPVTG